MTKAKSTTKPAAKTAASPMPTAQTLGTAPKAETPAPAKTVALRGGAAVSKVTLTGKLYRTAAPHNKNWWEILTKACAGDKPAAVADVVASDKNKAGVPAHFIGYALRRGYLKEAV